MECLAGLLAPVMLIIILGFITQFFTTRRAVKELQARLDRLEAVVR